VFHRHFSALPSENNGQGYGRHRRPLAIYGDVEVPLSPQDGGGGEETVLVRLLSFGLTIRLIIEIPPLQILDSESLSLNPEPFTLNAEPLSLNPKI
jgi:hypothetical protein